MSVEFVETSKFAAKRDHLFGYDDGYRRFQLSLIEDPRSGRVIPGTGGLRKVRWSDTSRQKGKRGGLRIIYLYVEEAQNILLLIAYDKDEADDLTSDQKRMWTTFAGEYRKVVADR